MLARRGTLLLLAALPCAAQDTLSFQGFTGLLNTPSAEVVPDGQLVALHANQVDAPYRGPAAWATTNMFTLGMFPGLEVNLRMTEFPTCTTGDLSGSLKYQVPGLPPWMPRVAFGVQDFGGTGYFRTKFAVLSQAFGPLNLSLGEGRGPVLLKGTFGGAEWRLAPWLQLLAERDTRDANLGLKLRTPPGLLPHGYALGLILKDALTYQPRHFDVAFTLAVPLGWRPAPPHTPPPTQTPPATVLPPASAALLPATAPLPSQLPSAPPREAAPVPAPRSLAKALTQLGFENVRTGSRGATLVVEYENNRYNHNELDGLGLVLGTTLANAPEPFATVLIAIRKQDLRLLELEGPIQALRAFFASSEPPGPGLAQALTIRHAESFRSTPGVTWTGEPENPGWFHSRLLLGPGLKTTVGAEVGAWNYRLSLAPDFQASLWPGAVMNYRGDLPLAWTRNYSGTGPFGGPGTTSPSLQRIWFSQDLPLADGLLAQVGGGAYSQQAQGLMGDLMWTPGTGRNRFTLKAAHFQNTGALPGPDARVGLAGYRAFLPGLNAYVEATAGQFLNNDHGVRLEVKRFFNDTSVSVYYSRTTLQQLGFSLTLPLTPRRDMAPGWLQVRGDERWEDHLSTVIRNQFNYLVPGLATVPDTTVNLERSFYNNDRLNEAYLLANLQRLREAYRIWRPAPRP